jgi:hypothetical protein
VSSCSLVSNTVTLLFFRRHGVWFFSDGGPFDSPNPSRARFCEDEFVWTNSLLHPRLRDVRASRECNLDAQIDRSNPAFMTYARVLMTGSSVRIHGEFPDSISCTLLICAKTGPQPVGHRFASVVSSATRKTMTFTPNFFLELIKSR